MYNTKEDQIRRDRCNYGYTMATLVFNTFRRYPRFIDNEEEFRYLEEAEKAAKKISNALETLSEEEIEMYLSGELPLRYSGPENDRRGEYDCPEYPLYFFADITLMNLDSLFIYEPQVSQKNKEKAKELRKLVEELRTKLVTLKHSERFDSSKHISPEAWKGIASSHGGFNMSTQKEEDLEHFVISYTLTSDDGVWRNGDYYYNNVYRSYYDHILYQEDIEEIYKRKVQREKQESEEYYAHFTKYFKNGVIPAKYKGFEEYLLDPTIDERIIKELGTFVLMYNDHENQRSSTDFAHSKYASFYLEDLQRAERLVKKEKEENQRKREEKDSAIEGARKRYQQKSFFWKMLNRKLNPERLDFESMETEEIKELYTGGKKTK